MAHRYEHIYRDCFGRQVEGHECEYCGEARPVRLWTGFEGCRDTHKVLMVEIEHPTKGRKAWCCVDCFNDIKNKLEGKDN